MTTYFAVLILITAAVTGWLISRHYDGIWR